VPASPTGIRPAPVALVCLSPPPTGLFPASSHTSPLLCLPLSLSGRTHTAAPANARALSMPAPSPVAIISQLKYLDTHIQAFVSVCHCADHAGHNGQDHYGSGVASHTRTVSNWRLHHTMMLTQEEGRTREGGLYTRHWPAAWQALG
jgi:hypothetical protein